MTLQMTLSHQDKDFLDLWNFKVMFCSCVVAVWAIRSCSDGIKLDGKKHYMEVALCNFYFRVQTQIWCLLRAGLLLLMHTLSLLLSLELTLNLLSIESGELQALVWKIPNKQCMEGHLTHVSLHQLSSVQTNRERADSFWRVISIAWHHTHWVRFQ